MSVSENLTVMRASCREVSMAVITPRPKRSCSISIPSVSSDGEWVPDIDFAGVRGFSSFGIQRDGSRPAVRSFLGPGEEWYESMKLSNECREFPMEAPA